MINNIIEIQQNYLINVISNFLNLIKFKIIIIYIQILSSSYTINIYLINNFL